MKLMLKKFSRRERLRLLRRGHFRMAWRGWELFAEFPGFKWNDPSAEDRPKIVGQILLTEEDMKQIQMQGRSRR